MCVVASDRELLLLLRQDESDMRDVGVMPVLCVCVASTCAETLGGGAEPSRLYSSQG